MLIGIEFLAPRFVHSLLKSKEAQQLQPPKAANSIRAEKWPLKNRDKMLPDVMKNLGLFL